MVRAVVLAGGWAHPGDDLIAEMHTMLMARAFEVEMITDPAQLVDALAHECDLLVVGACWFAMTDARYDANQRAEFAVDLDADMAAALQGVQAAGCPLLALHTAVICFDGAGFWKDWLGGTWKWDTSWHPVPAPVTVRPVPNPTIGFTEFTVTDELYQGLDVADTVTVIAESVANDPLVWLNDTATGRAAVNLLGHDQRSLTEEHHRGLNNALVDWLLAR